MALFVGDLASVCDESDLIKAFSRFGTVLEVKLMRDPITKRSLLYAFVTMGSPHESAKAIASLDKELLLGRRLKVRCGQLKRKDGARSSGNDRAKSLAVHVTFASQQCSTVVTEQLLWDLFCSVGDVTDVTVNKNNQDESGQKQKGYGFVYFAESQQGIDAAHRAVQKFNNSFHESIFFTCSFSYKMLELLSALPDGELSGPPQAYVPSVPVASTMAYKTVAMEIPQRGMPPVQLLRPQVPTHTQILSSQHYHMNIPPRHNSHSAMLALPPQPYTLPQQPYQPQPYQPQPYMPGYQTVWIPMSVFHGSAMPHPRGHSFPVPVQPPMMNSAPMFPIYAHTPSRTPSRHSSFDDSRNGSFDGTFEKPY